MPNIGTLITDAEAAAFVPGWDATLTALNTLMVKAVEAEVERACGRTFAQTTHADEEVTIRPHVERDGIAVTVKTQFRVKHAPIISWTSLKEVTSRDATTGAPLTTTTLTRDSYHVDLETGLVTAILATDTNYYPFTPMFREGTAVLLASYSAGYAAANIPYDLKLVVLTILSRVYQQQRTNRFDTDSSSFPESGTVNYLNVQLTEQERARLYPFRRMALR